MLLAKYRKCRVLNEEVLYHHEECQGSTGNLYVRYGFKFGKAGWHYHCHSCCSLVGGVSGFHFADTLSAPQETLDQLQELLKESKGVMTVNEIKLPDDITFMLPPIVRQYMLKYGLTSNEIPLSRFGWSPSLDRMIMPVYDKDESLIYWQGRNLGEVTLENPKYKNVYLSGSRDIYAKFERRDKFNGLGNTLVLVEAIISAVKLSRHVDTIALLGSYVPDSIIQQMKEYERVLIWLDPDKIIASITDAMRFHMLTGRKVMPIFSDKKPKQYNDREIMLHLALSHLIP